MDLLNKVSNSLDCERSGSNFRCVIEHMWIKFISISLKLLVGHTTFLTSLHWFRQWLGAFRQQTITGANVDPDLCRHVVSLGHHELIRIRTDVWSQILMLKNLRKWHRISAVIFASKKYITSNITELASLDFPMIWGKNVIFEIIFKPGTPFCQIWWLLHDTRITGKIILWVKISRSLVYTLRKRCFYEWKWWYDILFKIQIWNSLTFPWHLPRFRISLTIFQIPWQFPDLEKIRFSLTFPWRVATL